MRFTDTLVAVMVLLKKDNEVLLQKRINTGYMDGYWDFSATGHVEFGESIKNAGVREMKEELNIEINIDNMKLLTIMHKFTGASMLTYVNAFFIVEKFDGTPTINEEDKIEELKWVSLSELPERIIPDRLLALETDKKYLEIGWDNE